MSEQNNNRTHNIGARRVKLDQIRVKLMQELGGIKCTNCGYNSHFRALVIAYRDNKTKRTFGFSAYQRYLQNIKVAKQELNVLCCNCLRRKMNERRTRNPVGHYQKYIKQHDLEQRKAIMKILCIAWCKKCGEEDIEVLEIVPFLPWQYHRYKELFKSKRKILRYYLSQPECAIRDLQILCCNCKKTWQSKMNNFPEEPIEKSSINYNSLA